MFGIGLRAPSHPTTTTTDRAHLSSQNAPPGRTCHPAGGAPQVSALQSEIAASGIHPPAAPAMKPLTREMLRTEWRRADRANSAGAIRLGRLADKFARQEVDEGREPDRATAIQSFVACLQEDGFRGEALRVNQFIGIYHVAELLGAEAAEQVQVTILRELRPLIRRDKKDTWVLRSVYADQAQALWGMIVEKRLSVAKVADAVAAIRPRQTRKPRRKRVRVAALIRQLPRLSPEQLEELHTECERALRILRGVDAQRAAA